MPVSETVHTHDVVVVLVPTVWGLDAERDQAVPGQLFAQPPQEGGRVGAGADLPPEAKVVEGPRERAVRPLRRAFVGSMEQQLPLARFADVAQGQPPSQQQGEHLNHGLPTVPGVLVPLPAEQHRPQAIVLFDIPFVTNNKRLILDPPPSGRQASYHLGWGGFTTCVPLCSAMDRE